MGLTDAPLRWSFGHVAYVERVNRGVVYLSDSSWPTKVRVGGLTQIPWI
jgi:hypothetical protein